MTHTLGTSVDVTTTDGRRLHSMVRGDGEVTVVHESGMGWPRSCWGNTVPELAGEARCVVYDRAGLGRSPRHRRPRTLARLADDLVQVVEHHAPDGGPVVLVGHSWGGLIVRVAAARLGPGRVRGVVLVDPSDEHADIYFSRKARVWTALARPLAFVNARRGKYRQWFGGMADDQPADVVADFDAEFFTSAGAAGGAAELTRMIPELRRLQASPPDLTGILVTLVSGTLAGEKDTTRAPLNAAHRETVAAIAGARLVEAAGSGHMVMFTEPEVVVREVRALLAGAGAGRLDG